MLTPALTTTLEAGAVIFTVLVIAVCIIGILEHGGHVVPHDED